VSGETCCFNRIAELLAFVEAYTGPLSVPGAPATECDNGGSGDE
jgi:hypothetical protein